MPRELIEPKGQKRYARRAREGQLTSRQVEVGRSLKRDRRSKAKTVTKKGEGDRGDQRRSGSPHLAAVVAGEIRKPSCLIS